MSQVFPGRYMAQTDEPFVVFLIGMRINRLLAIRKWAPMIGAMSTMLRTLLTHPEKGMLGARTLVSWRGVTVIQYWRSFDDLERFARDADDLHMPAWRRFNKVVGYNDGAVGIWHESYLVEPGRFETLYGNMPVFGLAAATTHTPVAARREAARQRLEGEERAPVTTEMVR